MATPKERDELAERWQLAGFSAHQVASLAVAAQWPPIEIIKTLKQRYGLNIGGGKQLVDSLLPEEVRTANDYLQVPGRIRRSPSVRRHRGRP